MPAKAFGMQREDEDMENAVYSTRFSKPSEVLHLHGVRATNVNFASELLTFIFATIYDEYALPASKC